MFNSSLSDVPFALGLAKDNFEESIKFALKMMVEDGYATTYASIVESLGSQLFLDVVNDSFDSNEVWAKEFLSRTESVFMLSNQIPLLSLAKIEPVKIKIANAVPSDEELRQWRDSPPLPADPYVLFEPLRRFEKGVVESDRIMDRRRSNPIDVIAFSDPNDLLSYPVPPKAVNPSRLRVVNVFISIATTGYSMPFGKPQVVNPLKAHTGYQENQIVRKYLIAGQK